MGYRLASVSLLLWLVFRTCVSEESMTPEGSFAFQKAGNRHPPQVRKPPYRQTRILCPGANTLYYVPDKFQSLCGNLNDRHIPSNPMGQAPMGEQYPFDVIRNKALKFFAKTIPALKKDKHVPKVAKFEGTVHRYRERGGADFFSDYEATNLRRKREAKNISATADGNETNVSKDQYQDDRRNITTDQARQLLSALCGDKDNFFCSLMKMLKPLQQFTKNVNTGNDDDDVGAGYHGYFPSQNKDVIEKTPLEDDYGPGTPCPSYNEYVTPTYARNHHGEWRYVVQIPYEGYFTQTVQVTKCRNTECAYMRGACKSSKRWISLLVAEIYYPDLYLPSKTTTTKPAVVPHIDGYETGSGSPSSYPVYKPNRKPGNIGPFFRPAYNDGGHQGGGGGGGGATSNGGYHQSLLGGSKDSFLRNEENPMTTGDYYAYQEYLRQVATKQHKSEDDQVKQPVRIRTKRRVSADGFSPLSLLPSILLKRNFTDSSKSANDVTTDGRHCDGHDNLGCFVVRMYYDWFVVSGECKCWKNDAAASNSFKN